MEGSEHSLVPQWLKSSESVSRVASLNSQLTSSQCSDHINYSGHQWSSSSKGSGLSKSYSSSGRSWHGRGWEKDIDNCFYKDKLFLGECNHDHSDYVNNILSNKFEKDPLQRSQSMNSGRWRETWSPRTSDDVSNPQRNHRKANGMVTGVAGIIHKTVLNKEFPLLGAENKHGYSELGSVLSSSSSTSAHSLLTDTSAVVVSNGPTSASPEIPMTVGNSSMAVMMHQHNVSASTSSIAPGTMGLSMAEALAQGPPPSHTPPQLSASTQKLEELALKQSRLLIPMTPSTPRSLVASSLEKSKAKTGKLQYPFSYSRSPTHSLHSAHPNSDIHKIISGNSHNVSVSRELNGVSSAAKDNLSPNRSRVVLSPVGTTASTSISIPSRSSSNSTPSTWITMEKRPTFQTQSRSDFLKNLSRKSSSKNPCSDVFPTGTSEAGTRTVPSCLALKSRDSLPVDSSVVNSLTYSSIVTQNSNVSNEPLKISSNEEPQYSTNPVLYSDEEEIAFLRSLGWEENAGDDEGLTEEEIQDFYEKYMKLQL
ncbi:hypothetical protein SESBI_30534 [Sesbania bispinosa]|nr:hypothetical protein SESBI_30534 [Sesbania bispinosa]